MRTGNERGFSLLELTIGAMLTVGLMGAIFALVGRQQQAYMSESGTTDMNENMRVAVDMMTRDIQSAGVGLPRVNGSLASIYYLDGASGAADQILILNGDSYAPDADVVSQSSGTFVLTKPSEVTGVNSSTMTYKGASNATLNIYKAYSTSSQKYLWYDDRAAKVFQLTADASYNSGTGNVTATYDTSAANFYSPASTFGCPIDTGTPTTSVSKVAMLSTMVAYRVNASKELQRTEDLNNWYTVARGITNLQILYLSITTSSPPDPGIWTSAPADRRTVRALNLTISGETADLPNASKNYRVAVQQFDVTPRNFNLLNNTSLSSNTGATWNF
jgi:Tfp pilus assembly protein PilW